MRRKQEARLMTSGDNKRKHLEFIQAIITRMAGNLFYLKGWAITLIVGLFALAAKDAKPRFYFLAYAVAAILWILDGYFLRQERLFRSLFDQVRQIDEGDIDFSLEYQTIRRSTPEWLASLHVFSDTRSFLRHTSRHYVVRYVLS